MPKLTIVPEKEPSDLEIGFASIKSMARPEGIIQCNHCGGRTIMNTINGSIKKNGRKQGGTKIYKNICYHCHMRGIFSPMLPEYKVVKKGKPIKVK